MKGFFYSKKEIKNKTKSIVPHAKKAVGCVSCKLYQEAKNPRMLPYGNFKKQILNIGEAPGRIEDKLNKQWQGKVGKLLQYGLQRVGIDLFEDCLNINAVNCYPSNNKAPTNNQIACCRSKIFKVIKEYQPKVVILHGKSALFSFLGHRWLNDLSGITKWRGFTIPDRDYKAWVCPICHPSYILRSEPEAKTIWKQDLERISEIINSPLPEYKKPKIHIIDDLSILERLTSDCIAIDYETTGLKPQAGGHKIICASVSPNSNEAYVFLMPESRKKRKPFIDLLTNPKISKMAHNIKYEDTWTNVILRTEIKNWYWDSMLATHILDNRAGINGLKFQTYINFGVVDYASEVSPYLQAKDSNSINRIEEFLEPEGGKEKLRTYCGLDTVYQYRLAEKQMKEIEYNDLPF